MADELPPDRARLERAIVARFAVRLHLSLILLACFGAGLVVTKLLLMAGVQSMVLRYPIAVLAAYGTFVLGIRLWLAYAGYAGRQSPAAPARKASGSGVDVGTGDFFGSSGSGGSGSGSGAGSFRGGGGDFGGGGASASFADDAAASTDAPASSGGWFARSGGKSGGGGGLDLDDGWVLVALIALVAAVLGAGFYVVYMAPTILADAAFAALLSAGLVRPARRIGAEGWVGSVVRDTWIPLVVVLIFALVFAATAHHYHPAAHTLRQVIRML